MGLGQAEGWGFVESIWLEKRMYARYRCVFVGVCTLNACFIMNVLSHCVAGVE